MAALCDVTIKLLCPMSNGNSVFCCRARFMLEFPVSPPQMGRTIKCRHGREVNGGARLWVAIALSVWTLMH